MRVEGASRSRGSASREGVLVVKECRERESRERVRVEKERVEKDCE